MLKEKPLKVGEILEKLGGGRTTVWRKLKLLTKEGIIDMLMQ